MLKFVLESHAARGVPLTLYILESRPNCDGYKMFADLKKLGLDCKLVVDGAVGVVLEKVDYVITGAKIVTENGGIINSLGTYTLAICAETFKKPVYVFAENYKFMRTFVITQKDIRKDGSEIETFKQCRGLGHPDLILESDDVFSPPNDFVPSHLISYIVSDSRIFKSTAVSDEFLQTFD